MPAAALISSFAVPAGRSSAAHPAAERLAAPAAAEPRLAAGVRSERFPMIDSLRAIAALSVFAFHLLLQPGFFPPPDVSRFTVHLDVGVSVFFVISGFLIYRPFARARLEGRSPPSGRRYARRRFMRIVPAYWIALVLIALWLGLSGVFTARGIPTYFGFLQGYDRGTVEGGIPQAWTIGIEVVFYALLPLWALLLRRRRFSGVAGFVRTELVMLGGIVLLSTAWKLMPWHDLPRYIETRAPVTLTLPEWADQLALGMGLAVASVVLAGRAVQPGWVRAVGRRPWVPWLLALLAFAAMGLQLGPLDRPDDQLGYLIRHWLASVVAVGLVLPAVFGQREGGAVRRLLAHPALRWVGLVSYGLYLWHLAVLTKMTGGDWLDRLGKAGFTAVALALSLTLAAASWYLVEERALRLAGR